MSRPPSYPKDAPVGAAEAEAAAEASEAAAAAKAVKAVKAGDGRGEERSGRTRHLVTGAAIGIGSAALVAALLYTRKGRGEKGGNG
jgi:hypothetical protein